MAARAKKGTAARRKPPHAGARADYGARVDAFYARQPPPLREVLEALRALVEEAIPDAESSLKWGMPFYTVDGAIVCSTSAHRAHVNLILWGPPSAFPDPGGRLAGTGKAGRHLRLTRVDEIPRAAVRRWVRIARDVAKARLAKKVSARPARASSRPRRASSSA